MGFEKGNKQRPATAGRKKGVPNKGTNPLTLDLVETLKKMGHDPAAFQVQIAIDAYKRYKEIMRTKGKFGAAGALETAHKANAELLKYIYPTRKAIEGANGQSLNIASLIAFLKEDISEGDE